MDLADFMDSTAYRSTADRLSRRLHISLSDNYPETLLSSMHDRLAAASLTVDELASALRDDGERVERYIAGVLHEFHGRPIEEEFTPGEEPGADDGPTVIDELGFSKDFIVLHLINFWLLEHRPDELEPYLKTTRMPGAKKHAAALRRIYRAAIA